MDTSAIPAENASRGMADLVRTLRERLKAEREQAIEAFRHMAQGKHVGKNVKIFHGVEFSFGYNLTVEDNCVIHTDHGEPTIIGATAGYKGGRLDDLIMRVTDVALALPFLVVLVIARGMLQNISWITAVTGESTSVRFTVILLSIFGWMGVARLVRGQVKQLKEREFIEAARALGASTRRIMFRHLLPNSIGQIMVALTLAVVGAITAEATLSFFGWGPDAGSGMTSLGLLIRDSKKAVPPGYWWLVVFPGGFFIVLSLCINFIGDGLRDALDPRRVL